MAVVAASASQALSGEEFLQQLEAIRQDFTRGGLFRQPVYGLTKEQLADAKRRRYLGGFGNHRFDGERYLNAATRELRREYLRTVVDEGGQTLFGGDVPSHNELDRWEGYELGLTPEEILQLQKRDAPPESLLISGWWIWTHRTSSWPIATGAGLVGEGEKNLPHVRQQLLEEIERMRKEYAAMGIRDVERAVALKVEHAGADMVHGAFSAKVVREFVNTPELQEEYRKAFILNLHGRGSRRGW